MAHQYKAGDVVTVFQFSPTNELVIEGKATIQKRVAEIDGQYRVEFSNKPGAIYSRFVDRARMIRRRICKTSIGAQGDSRPQQWGRLYHFDDRPHYPTIRFCGDRLMRSASSSTRSAKP